MATFWEIAAHSVDHMFSFVFLLFVILVISRFGFEIWIWVLSASVPDLCILFTFMNVETPHQNLNLPDTPYASRRVLHGVRVERARRKMMRETKTHIYSL